MSLEVSSLQQLFQLLQNVGPYRLVILKAGASWCGPCKAVAPYFKAMANQNPAVVFVDVDIDEADEIATYFQVSAVPTFVFLVDGKEIDRATGGGQDVRNRISELVKRYQ